MPYRRSMFEVPPAGPVTKRIAIAILVASVVFALSGRNGGFGIRELSYSVPALLELQLWRLVTYPFVIGEPLGLILSLVIFWLFGGAFEHRWGSKDFFRFFALSCIGAGILAVPLYVVFNVVMPFRDVGLASGPAPAIDAMLVALALTMPDSNVLFGFVLPIRARTVVFLLLGFDLLRGLMTGVAGLSVTLAGMVMGYLLVTGTWRPQSLLTRWRTWRNRRRRRGLYVVPPNNRNPTLH